MKSSDRYVYIRLVAFSVVVAVSFLLSSTPRLTGRRSPERIEVARIQILELECALKLFRFDTTRYPTTDEGLDTLIHKSGDMKSWAGPYLKRTEVGNDPWGRPYVYKCPPGKGTYDLISYGEDGVPGGAEQDEDILRLDREFPKRPTRSELRMD